jgi:hypothetical protein
MPSNFYASMSTFFRSPLANRLFVLYNGKGFINAIAFYTNRMIKNDPYYTQKGGFFFETEGTRQWQSKPKKSETLHS